MNQVKVKKQELLDILRKNRENHLDTFNKAVVLYRKRVIEELERSLADAKAGNKIRKRIELPEPMNQTRDYDLAIRMLEMSVDDEITLSSQDFSQFVLDEWNWAGMFYASTKSYVDGAI